MARRARILPQRRPEPEGDAAQPAGRSLIDRRGHRACLPCPEVDVREPMSGPTSFARSSGCAAGEGRLPRRRHVRSFLILALLALAAAGCGKSPGERLGEAAVSAATGHKVDV